MPTKKKPDEDAPPPGVDLAEKYQFAFDTKAERDGYYEDVLKTDPKAGTLDVGNCEGGWVLRTNSDAAAVYPALAGKRLRPRRDS